MSETSIEWTQFPGTVGRVWNPVRACSMVSAGCSNCYAMRMAHRFSGKGQPYEGLTKRTQHGPVWTGEVRFVPEMLAAPLRWRKPSTVFVNSMSDLFHERVTNEQIAAVFGVMAACPQHTFIVLTKRSWNMREWFRWLSEKPTGLRTIARPEQIHSAVAAQEVLGMQWSVNDVRPWPLPNVILGVSVENQATTDRIPLLLATPAACRVVSCEPLLGPVVLDAESLLIDWLITGGESGPGARPCRVGWISSLVRQCGRARVPCFVKQLGAEAIDDVQSSHPCAWPQQQAAGSGKRSDPAEWPEDLRVRQWPEVTP